MIQLTNNWFKTSRANLNSYHMTKDLLRTLRQIWVEPNRNNRWLDNAGENVSKIVANLTKDGVVILDKYFSKEKVDILRAEVDRLFAENKEFVWTDSTNSDNRLHGTQRKSDSINEFNQNTFFSKIAYAFLGENAVSFSTLAGRLLAAEENAGSGGGWHRDTPHESRQLKCILYLDDVELENGPFQYLHGTQHQVSLLRNIWRHKIKYGQSRFLDEEIERLITDKQNYVKTYTAKAGTVILTNTFGIHRGMPIQEGQRYALTNYYYAKEGFDEEFYEKKFNLIK